MNNLKPEYIVGIAVIVLLFVGGLALYLTPSQADRMADADFTVEAMPYVEIVDPAGFVNTEGITLGEMIGEKIILVDFLTYSCINCQRTFPYLNAWYERYKDQGLEIVGIHTPEFAFEKNIDNVRDAMTRFGISYPIVLDNDYTTWRAYGNRYWPRKYLIDIHGNIVYDHIGEGAYEETEMKIRELLAELADILNQEMVSTADELVAKTVVDTSGVAQSPETYFGSLRNELLGNGEPGKTGEQTLTKPTYLYKNNLYLTGTWNIQPEYAEGTEGDEIWYKFDAREIYLVAEADGDAEIEIYQDDELRDTITVNASMLYTILRNEFREEHILNIKVKSGTVRFFAFTFG